MNLLLFLLIGLLAGWIASKLMRGEGMGILADLVIGVVGAFIGGLIFDWLDIHATGLLGSLAAAVVGAVILLAIAGLFREPAA